MEGVIVNQKLLQYWRTTELNYCLVNHMEWLQYSLGHVTFLNTTAVRIEKIKVGLG